MNKSIITLIKVSFVVAVLTACSSNNPDDLSSYNVYRGNTHAHTIFTWTHGGHRAKSISDLSNPTEFHPDWNVPAGTDWRDHTTINLDPDAYTNLQGLPANHFKLAIEHGFDFYAITDHSQEPTLQPVSIDNPVWKHMHKIADEFNQKPNFVTLTGFEYSRNTDADGGNGHINVLNSAEYVNADYGQRGPAAAWPEANWSLPQFYNWLKTAKAHNNNGKVAVGFNHPRPNQYNDWDHLDNEIVEKISTFELHSNYKKPRWKAYLRALNKGWKVSPIGVLDNHKMDAIGNPNKFPPTLVLAKELTREAITEALQQRRTYASWIEGVTLRYAVNGKIMGSTIQRNNDYVFDIQLATRPSLPAERIKCIQILRNHPDGKDDVEIVAEKVFDGIEEEVTWQPVIPNSDATFFFMRIFHNKDLKDDGTFKEYGSTISGPVWIEE